jgi:hypothetical protein
MVNEGSATYELAADLRWIRCKRCGATSHNADDVARLYCAGCHSFHEGERPDWWRAGEPPKQLLEYVHWKLTGARSSDAFTMRLLQLIVRADPFNRGRLARAFPRETAALEAWEASERGDFELEEVVQSAAYCGCRFAPGSPWPMEQVHAHYDHTFQALLLWELLVRKGEGQDVDRSMTMGTARNQLLDGLKTAFPELRDVD